MELVYLWVEEYKNIYHQGFNFSPRFKCEYDEKKKELNIIDKEETGEPYPKNFFGENINITAIVGENGSGKSSILQCINKILTHEFKSRDFLDENYDSYLEFTYLLVLRINSKNYYLAEKIDCNQLEIFHLNLEHFIYFNDNISLDKKFAFDKYQISKMIAHSYRTNIDFKVSSFMYIPNKILIKKKKFKEILDELLENNELFFYDRTLRDPDNYENKYKCREQIKNIWDNETNEYNKFLILFYILKEKDLSPHLFSNINELLKESILSEIISEDNFNKYFREIKKEINDLDKKEKLIYIDKYYDFFEFEFSDSLNRHFNLLSHGEKILFGQLLNIYYISTKKEENNFIFLLDEPEISLHPNWQKSYISEVNTLLSKQNKNYALLIGTHSPLLLSDFPKNNVIFLKKDEENGNCLNDTDNIDINPFGANIHTLLSHGFFMKDGLMGEFAKNKISKILKFLSGENKFIDLEVKILPPLKIQNNFFEKNLKPIIEFIGEDFLKEKLLKMYEIKFPKSNKAKIKELENEIRRLKNASN